MWGGGGRCVGGCFILFGCFVDIKESLAGGGVNFVYTLAVGAFQSGVRAGLSSCLAGGADMVACVVFPSTELTFDLLSANCRVVTKPWQALHWLLGCVSLYVAHLICTAPISSPFLMTPSASCCVLKQSRTEEWSFPSLASFLVNHLGGAASWMLLL